MTRTDTEPCETCRTRLTPGRPPRETDVVWFTRPGTEHTVRRCRVIRRMREAIESTGPAGVHIDVIGGAELDTVAMSASSFNGHQVATVVKRVSVRMAESSQYSEADYLGAAAGQQLLEAAVTSR